MTKKNLPSNTTKSGAHHHKALDGESAAFRVPSAPLWVRVGAMVFGPSLDVRLAEGQEPDASPLLTTRALRLSSLACRRAIAASWLDALVQARERPRPFDPRVRPLRRRVFDAEGQIRALAEALMAPLVTARGVAMASSLLSDGGGPLFNPSCALDLRSVLSDVLRQLDPLFAVA